MTQWGKLYIVATPIGNLEDISNRAITTLQKVDRIAAEDTRHSAKLLAHYQISTPMLSLHEHNEQTRYTKVIELLTQGLSVALISDAGTPLISDPGFRLVHEARANNIEIVAIPGACAAIAALSISGLPTNRFIFEGFLPAKQQGRIKQLEILKNEQRTLIFYESTHRLLATLKDMATVFEADRQVVIAKELTKLYENVYVDNLNNLIAHFEKNPSEQQGEFVLLVKGSEITNDITDSSDSHLLTCLLEALPAKQAVQVATKITGKKKNTLYKLALTLKENSKDR